MDSTVRRVARLKIRVTNYWRRNIIDDDPTAETFMRFHSLKKLYFLAIKDATDHIENTGDADMLLCIVGPMDLIGVMRSEHYSSDLESSLLLSALPSPVTR